MARHVGVDGCKAGWFAVTRTNTKLVGQVFLGINDVASMYGDAERIFIDIPIGLPWADAPIRPCDRMARQVLGKPRNSSVFPVPCREALSAKGVEEARKINQMCIGRSVGEQTWGISKKIKQVDDFLLSNESNTRLIREVHPEVCFWALAGRKSMKHRKTTRQGKEERLRVLQQFEPSISTFVKGALSTTSRKDVQEDDVLDAAVAFLTAEASRGDLMTLAGKPSRDLMGLPIEMYYLSI